MRELRELYNDRFTPGNGNGFLGSVAPESVAELRRLVEITAASSVALLPRGAATSPYHPDAGHVSGLAVSFQHLNRILHVDPAGHTVKVEPGVTWRRLANYLWPLGFMLRVLPSSQDVSTVGGFVAQGGVGIGSYEFGSIDESVVAVRMMTANGQIVTLHGSEVDLAVALEGRTGLLLEILLRVQPLAAVEPLVATFNRIAELEACLAEVSQHGLPLWSVAIVDRAAVDLQTRLGMGSFSLPQGRYALLCSFRKGDRQRVLPRLRGAVLAAGGGFLSSHRSHDDWVACFMGLQACGTTPVPMQFRVPLGRLGDLLHAIDPEQRNRLAFEAVAVDGARFIVLRVFLIEPPHTTEENQGIANQILDLVKEVGGQTYATGRLFKGEAHRLYGLELLDRVAQFRWTADPDDRLNPGVAFESR